MRSRVRAATARNVNRNEQDTGRREMQSRDGRRGTRQGIFLTLGLAALLGATLGASWNDACAKQPAPAGRTFASPEAATEALVAAAKSDDTAALIAILGPDSKSIITSGDPVADEASRSRFAASYDAGHKLVASGDGEMTLETGSDGWPMPIPLVKTDSGWRFDTARGKQEILDRRIGKDELSAIQACLAYVDAQREYNDRNPQGELMPTYAQHFSSSAGKRDGLYWPEKEGEAPSPLGPLFAEAKGHGYALGSGSGAPYLGYHYRILDAQGPHAPGGKYSYVVRGKMIGGFAMVAYPAQWRASGVYTFIVNHEGVVYEKDLGPDTEKIASKMTAFDPDSTWHKVDISTPAAPAPTNAGSGAAAG